MHEPAHSSRSRSPSPAKKLPPPSPKDPVDENFLLSYRDTGSRIRSDKQMRESAHKSPLPSPAKKLRVPFPKDLDDNYLSYQETSRRKEAGNLNNSTKNFMSPTKSTVSKLNNHPSLKKERINESPDHVDDGGALRVEYEKDGHLFLRHRSDKRSNLIQRIASDDFETVKVGGYSSVFSRVFEFLLLLMILLLSTACITLMSTDLPCRNSTCYHHHHYLDNYPVAFLRLRENNGAPTSHDFMVVEPPMDVEQAGKMMAEHPVTDMHIQQVETYSSGNEPMKAAVEQVAQITLNPDDKGRITIEKGKGKDLSPKANHLARNWGIDFDDDYNRPSLVPIFVVTAIASMMVLVVLISCTLARKRRNYNISRRGIDHQYQRHLEPGLLHTQNPDMPETWSSSSSSVRGRGAPSLQQPSWKK